MARRDPVGAENACYLGVCAEEAMGSVPARGGWWRVGFPHLQAAAVPSSGLVTGERNDEEPADRGFAVTAMTTKYLNSQ